GRDAIAPRRELHPFGLLDSRVGARGLVGRDGLNLAFAEESALGVDLLGGQDVAFQHWRAQHRRRPREERHVADFVWGIGNVPLRRGLRRGALRDECTGGHAPQRRRPTASARATPAPPPAARPYA